MLDPKQIYNLTLLITDDEKEAEVAEAKAVLMLSKLGKSSEPPAD